jgi:glycosyltransferase involved in cell wall biosynthesis
MKVAIVHDWINGMRGGERCLLAFLTLYPQADIFTLFHVPGTSDARIDARVKTVSSLNRLPGVKRYYRYLLPFYPRAARAFNFSGYDLVISLSHAAAKNVRVPREIPHICYCFTPMRYVWDQIQNYFGKLTPFLFPLIRRLRVWDFEGAQTPTALIAISRFVAARIRCFYNRPAYVVYPPVDTSWIAPIERYKKGEAFLVAGALVPYKRVDLAIAAFRSLPEDQLWVVGTGPEEERLRAMAPPNVRFFGRVSDAELADFYRHARALVFPGTEDFGMIPVECMAAGRPVIALYEGALKESIVGFKHWNKTHGFAADMTGVFFRRRENGLENQTAELITAIQNFKEYEAEFTPENCVKQAASFDLSRFYEEWRGVVQGLVPGYAEGVADSSNSGYSHAHESKELRPGKVAI